jgi:hypothetical protein
MCGVILKKELFISGYLFFAERNGTEHDPVPFRKIQIALFHEKNPTG